jgi:hypothetical protein
MINIVIINGPGRSGKDEFVLSCRDVIERQGLDINVINYSSIETVRKACFHYFIAPETSKTDAVRVFLSKVKDAWIEFNNGPFFEFIHMIDKIAISLYSFQHHLVFCHIREPEEIEKIKKYFEPVQSISVNTLFLKRPGETIPECEKDKSCVNYQYDLEIENTSLGLKEEAIDFLDLLY